jgi:hypothetical protein
MREGYSKKPREKVLIHGDSPAQSRRKKLIKKVYTAEGKKGGKGRQRKRITRLRNRE